MEFYLMEMLSIFQGKIHNASHGDWDFICTGWEKLG